MYAGLVACFLTATDFLYARRFISPVQPMSTGSTGLVNRMAWYREHLNDYNLVFVGDSRTYCGMHPELIDPLLNTSSINLALFENWFLTQLPQIQELAPLVPKEATVVWSVGMENFVATPGVRRVYPVGILNALHYLEWSLPSDGLVDNVLYYNPVLHFLAVRGDARQDFVELLDHPLHMQGAKILGDALIGTANAAEPERPTAPSVPQVSDEDLRTLTEQWQKDPRVASVSVVRDNGRPTSLTIYFRRGSYYRVELDPEFFREKQRHFAPYTSQPPRVEEGYWRVFEEILRTFKNNKVNLIVNEVEEAPFVYGGQRTREVWRKVMRDVVERRVLDFGFPYTRVSLDKLSNDDYFDYNHLNSSGAAIFTPMLAEQLRPYVHPYQAPRPATAAMR
ncbi:MAG TPA: hypothetical protein VFA12_03205 [Stellaceae bacterium]|nr:hypothetical protein [Stellaceae bacterium]